MKPARSTQQEVVLLDRCFTRVSCLSFFSVPEIETACSLWRRQTMWCYISHKIELFTPKSVSCMPLHVESSEFSLNMSSEVSAFWYVRWNAFNKGERTNQYSVFCWDSEPQSLRHSSIQSTCALRVQRNDMQTAWSHSVPCRLQVSSERRIGIKYSCFTFGK
jgi:hypothetical protein